MLNRDCLHAFLSQFREKFRNTMFNVIGNLIATIAATEIVFHVVEIGLKQLAGVFVNGVERAKKVDGDILFHSVKFFEVLEKRYDIRFHGIKERKAFLRHRSPRTTQAEVAGVEATCSSAD